MAKRDYSTLTDQDLQRLHAAEDPHAFRVLTERHFRPLLDFLRALAHQDADAENYCLVSITKLHLHIDGKDSETIINVGSWLKTTGSRLFYDELRKNERSKEEFLEDIAKAGELSDEEEAYDFTKDEHWRILISALPRLPYEQLRVITDRYFNGISPREIARAQNCTVEKVYRLLQLGIRTLKRHCTNNRNFTK